MNRKFIAEPSNINIDVVTIEGEEITLVCQHKLHANNAKKILEKWSKIEENEESNKLDIIAKELSLLYNDATDSYNSEWFMNNFDFSTLQAMLEFVAESIVGAEKKTEN